MRVTRVSSQPPGTPSGMTHRKWTLYRLEGAGEEGGLGQQQSLPRSAGRRGTHFLITGIKDTRKSRTSRELARAGRSEPEGRGCALCLPHGLLRLQNEELHFTEKRPCSPSPEPRWDAGLGSAEGPGAGA